MTPTAASATVEPLRIDRDPRRPVETTRCVHTDAEAHARVVHAVSRPVRPPNRTSDEDRPLHRDARDPAILTPKRGPEAPASTKRRAAEAPASGDPGSWAGPCAAIAQLETPSAIGRAPTIAASPRAGFPRQLTSNHVCRAEPSPEGRHIDRPPTQSPIHPVRRRVAGEVRRSRPFATRPHVFFRSVCYSLSSWSRKSGAFDFVGSPVLGHI